jgi:hypothetical protein
MKLEMKAKLSILVHGDCELSKPRATKLSDRISVAVENARPLKQSRVGLPYKQPLIVDRS